MIRDKLYILLSSLYPKTIRQTYKKLLIYSHIGIKPARFIGFILFAGLGAALTVSLVVASFSQLSMLVVGVAVFFLFQVGTYTYLNLRADSKGKFVEGVLPDVLQLMASNLRAGMTTDRALLLASRPEFGFFQDEINLIGKEITMGKPLEDALLRISDRIKSERLQKTMYLIVSGLKAGGELASLLENTAANLRNQSLLDQKIRSNVFMYVIFIFAAVGFGAPMLFGLSTVLVTILTSAFSGMEMPESGGLDLPMSVGQSSIPIDFLMQYAVIALITSSILGSLTLGLISRGREKDGVRYIPFMILLTLVGFFLTRKILLGVLSTFFDF